MVSRRSSNRKSGLREVCDGSWTRHLGVDGGTTLAWSGKIGLIAAVTPAIDSHHSVMATMGERFVFIRLQGADPEKQAGRALENAGSEGKMRDDLRAAADRFFEAVVLGTAPPNLSPRDHERLKAIATMAAIGRSAVERDGYRRDVLFVPPPEAPARLVRVLAQLLKALRIIRVPETEAWGVVERVGFDCMPALRRDVLLRVAESSKGRSLKTLGINQPEQTVRRCLEDLELLGILSDRLVKPPGGKNKEQCWSLAQTMRRLYDRAKQEGARRRQ